MTASKHIIALLQSHIDGDNDQFLSVAMQLAAHEARRGHNNFAKQLRELIDEARTLKPNRSSRPVPLAQPKGDLAALISVSYSDTRLASMVLTKTLKERIKRVITEQRRHNQLLEHGLQPRRKILLVGPPGSGKTMTASALAGELTLPLFTIVFESLITRFMGETASKLRLVFDAMLQTRGIYFFDEFDAIGARRAERNDVGEIRRVLNSFLQFLENDDSESLIIAATNHPQILDPALFRRFDDVIRYDLPDSSIAKGILKARLSNFETNDMDWKDVVKSISKLSQAEIARAADEATKRAILNERTCVTPSDLLAAIAERKASIEC